MPASDNGEFYAKVQFLSRPWTVAILAFLLAALASAALIGHLEHILLEQKRTEVSDHLASNHAQAIQNQITRALTATYALAALIRQGNGAVLQFDAVATEMLPFYPGVAALQLAPGGVIQQVVPLAGNEKVIGYDQFQDPARAKEAFLARDTGRLTLAGPFNLIQGGLGAVGRLPVFLDDEQGRPVFWGFAIVLLRFPDVLGPAHLSQLVEQGFNYELWRIHPDTAEKQVIAASSTAGLIEPVGRSLDLPNGAWTLSVSPITGWHDVFGLMFRSAAGLIFSLLVAVLVASLLRLATALRQAKQTLVARQQAETALRISEARYARAVRGTSDGLWDWNLQTGEDYHSPRYKELLGYADDELDNTLEVFYATVHPEDLDRVQAAEYAHLERHEPYDIELRMRTRGGDYRWFRSRGQAERDAAGKPVLMAGSITDITERKRLEEELRNQNLLLNTVLANVAAHVYMKDREGRFLYVNQAVAELLGRPADQIVGHLDAELLPPADLSQVRTFDLEVFATGVRQNHEEIVMDQEGGARYFWSVRVPLVDAGQPNALIGFSSDVTELHHLREELERRATTDFLTGLANRGHFYEQAEIHFARAQRYGEDLSLLILDIDHFKSVNDTHGHQAGDGVLCGVAQHFRQGIRICDLVGRVGGEEFALILPNTDLEAAVQLADRLRETLSKRRFECIGGNQLVATVSIGAASLLPTDASLDSLYSRADQALYRAKGGGRNRVATMEAKPSSHGVSTVRLIWKASYDCGEPVIDREHRELFRLANKLLDLAMADTPPTVFNAALDALLAHVVGHFADEEVILRRYGYADLDRHADLHKNLVQSALALRQQAEQRRLGFGDLVAFLAQEVVAHHMLRADRAFYGLFRQQRSANETS